MLNNKQLSELISKSLNGLLSVEEQAAMGEHLENNDDSRAFANLSQAINNSVLDVGKQSVLGDMSIGDGLSKAAKSRLQDSVNAALTARASGINLDSSEDRALANTFDVRNDDTFRVPKASPEETPERIRESKSQFTLIKEIGQGGLGRVWLAKDKKVNRKVALKEMNDKALQLKQAWSRFNREAEITGQLEHPNVVSLYQYGNDSRTGEPFYAMRFVGKRTLADAIAEYHDQCQSGACDALVLHRLLTIFLDVCQAIAYAHSRGVIHRDLKPENVALDNFGQVIVLDWGLAKLTDETEFGISLSDGVDLTDDAIAQTMAGQVIGTPMFMAPEQASGDLDAIDKQTDVYGLGAILFSILTGTAPHDASHLGANESSDISEILKAIAERETPRPRNYRPEVPLELDQIVRKAMAVKKYARYESAVQLANAVERWMVDMGSRHSQYENLRIDGRELSNNVKSAVRDLETNVRFMSKLPPIQELIKAESAEDVNVWRDRLSTIFQGLLNAKSDFRSVVYSKVEGDQFTELVRVERHSKDHATVRSIPRSRLSSGTISEYTQKVLARNPDEVFTSLACSPLCGASQDAKRLSLVAGVPVFDDFSEEVFGVVLIECDMYRLMSEQMNRRFAARDVAISCFGKKIVIHNNEKDGIIAENRGQPLLEKLPQFEHATEVLQTKKEYIDETDRLVYGTSLWLEAKEHGIMFLLSQ